VEVELKLALDPADVPRLREAAALAASKPSETAVDGVYLDTPDCEVAGNGMALRVRRAGRRWMQCLKAGHSGTGGLHARHEWEYPQPRAKVDLSLFSETPLASLPSAASLHEKLVPAFRVRFDRTHWKVSPHAGTHLEVALDVGVVSSGRKNEPICEVEIELLEGDASRAFDFAESLLESVTLRPSAVTKARRGYRLFNREALKPARARAPQLEPGMDSRQAARAIVGAALDQLQANEEGLIAGTDPEFVHQARVALRRMRSVLRIFRDAVGREQARTWREELAAATRALGDARDWDVFAQETLPAISSAYGDDAIARSLAQLAGARRRQARAGARDAIRSREYAAAILHVSRWLAAPGEGGEPERVADFAARALPRRHKRLAEEIERLPDLGIEERHRVRIHAKRMRYAVEGLASVLGAQAAHRFAKRLSELQDALGRANDAVTGLRLLESLKPPEAFAGFARGWLASRRDADAAQLKHVAARVAGASGIWD
jgi:inorganic triphosphatase YgiF